MKYLKKFNEDAETKKNHFDYFNDMTDQELRDYEVNFKHDFDNPQHHNPEYVAYKTACKLKNVFVKRYKL